MVLRRYQYDLNNTRTRMSDHFGGITTYDYYDRGLLHTLTDRNNGITHYDYYANGLLWRMDYPNGVRAEYTYSERNFLETLTHTRLSDSVLVAGFTYEYNPTYWGKTGTRTAMIEDILKPDSTRIQSRVDYEYDALYRLTRKVRTGSLPYDKSYTYDDVGNRETMVAGLISETVFAGDQGVVNQP